MLTVTDLTVCRGGRPVLENVSFSLPAGQLTAVLGLNGAGKTTLLKAILGFCPKAGGSVTAEGRPLDRMSPADRAKKLAYVPQIYDGGFHYPVEEFVSLGVTAYLGAFSQPGRDSLERAEKILRSLDCEHLLGRSMEKLSGGERRMAYLARAIMQDADFLLLDEPVSSLDFSRQHQFLSALRRYIARRQAGCLVTIHAPELAYTYGDRILIFHEKRLLADLRREEPDFCGRLARTLGQLYGPALRVGFQEDGLVLGWREEAVPPDIFDISPQE